ncbi:MAG TPA: oligosaccharide flippase family protein [Patescibacteria group bacterium]|nr:oligosaccharide flippase family protein [Patescibacteria group bacterium]
MSFLKQLTAHTFYQVIAQIASSGSSFLIAILVARLFGVGAYGDFAKVTAFVSLFYLLVDFGLNAMFLQKEEAHLRFRDLFYTRIILSFILVFLVNAIAFILPYSHQTQIGFSNFVKLGILIFSLTIITEGIIYSAFAVFQRRVIYQRFMTATIIGSLSIVFFVSLFGLSHLSLVYVFAGFVLGSIIEAGFSLFYTEEKLFPIVFHPSFIKSLAKETLPVTIMLISNLIYFRIDMLLLSALRPSHDVALYDVSYKVFDFLIALPLFLSNVLYPRLIAEAKNTQTVSRKHAYYVCLFVGLGILTTIIMWFVSPLIFSLISPAFSSAIVPMRLLLLSLPVFFATSIMQWILLTKKKQKTLAVIYAVFVVINILANAIYIPHYGYVASAIITGVCETAIGLLMMLYLFFKL